MAAVTPVGGSQSSSNLPIQEIKTLIGHGGSVRCVQFSTDGNYLLSGGYDKTIKLWNPYKGTLIREYLGHGYQVLGIDVSHDNSQIASCGGDKQPFFWDVATGSIIRKFQGHLQQVNCISFNADSSVLVTGSYDQTVKCWDCKSRSYIPIQTMEDAKDSVTSIVVTDYEIITGSVDGCIRTYDMRKGELRRDQMGLPVTSVSLSNDGHIFLVSCLDNVLRLIDKDDGTMYREYRGHVNKEFQLDSCFSYDDAYVLSGSEDGAIFIWSLESGEVAHVISGHSKTVSGLCYHPNRPILASSSADKTVKLWAAVGAID